MRPLGQHCGYRARHACYAATSYNQDAMSNELLLKQQVDLAPAAG